MEHLLNNKVQTINDVDVEDFSKQKPIKGRKRISMLLGAGFSVPLGYPMGSCLSCKVQQSICNKTIAFTNGILHYANPNSSHRDDHQKCFEFLLPLMNEYLKSKEKFDYEKFYDYLSSGCYFDGELYTNTLKKDLNQNIEKETLVNYLLNIYNQIVQVLIRDREGRQYYGNIEQNRCEFLQNYQGFIDYISLLVDDYIVDVHTLNHDLLFESFSNILKAEINDGFKEYGSKYYGILFCNGFEYTCRLQAYSSDNYDQTSINLFKLHGSVNYVPFYKKGIDGISRKTNYLKANKGININQLYMDDENNKGEYLYSQSERHSDFLTGTTKAIRYNDFFFQELFCNFKCNLKNAEKLIIIGYGGKDKEINKYIVDNFDYEHKPVFIVDPKPSETLMNFANRINAQIIEKTVSEIDCSDFESTK